MSITIGQILQTGADLFPASPAIGAPGRSALTYERLYRLAGGVAAWLNDRGLGRRDRVAIALPNGPEMAAAFLGVSAAATSAPLDPASRAEHAAFCLTTLGAKAIIVQRGLESPARDAARSCGVKVI